MATFPDDATAPITAYPVTATVTYSSTAAQTYFNLPATISFAGEVAAFSDGVLQATDSYALSNAGQSISFAIAPSASNLTLQTVSIPAKFRTTRSTFTTLAVEYSNTSTKIIDSNTYLINANTESFALPAGANTDSVAELQVYVSGIYQAPTAYTYPSTVLGYNGIDIGDNTATKLLLNFVSNLTDESPYAKTVTSRGTTAYSSNTLTFSGTNSLEIPSHQDYDIHIGDFTVDTHFSLDAGAKMGSNQTLMARYQDADDYYFLRVVGSNSNVAFVSSVGGSITELYGGNVNAATSYHVALSYERTTENLRLYVNNVLVDHGNFLRGSTASGPLQLGNANVVGEMVDGSMSFFRYAAAPRYKTASIQPIASPFGQHDRMTVISGAPLGAINSADQLSVRVYDSTTETLDRFTSMSDRKPDKGIGSTREFGTVKFMSQAGYEKRRLKSRRSKRAYDLTYSTVTGVEKTAIENFYVARSGEFESFSFDLSHINETGTITVRFDGPLSVEQTYSNGNRLIDNFYSVSFKLQEVFD